jgi:hypothetical protein
MAYIKAIKNLTIHNRNLKESNRDKKIDWFIITMDGESLN